MKYYRGDYYTLRAGPYSPIKTYKCIAIINTINGVTANVVVMLQVSGPISQKFCLNKCDCRKLHIEYKFGLECFSQNTNFKKLKNGNNL